MLSPLASNRTKLSSTCILFLPSLPFWLNKTFCPHIPLLEALHVSRFHIKLINRPWFLCCNRQNYKPDSILTCHWCKYLLIINSILLLVSFCNESRLVLIHLTVFIQLGFENPFDSDCFMPLRKISELPSLLLLYGFDLTVHGFLPFLLLYRFFIDNCLYHYP